jgi:aminoglycoside phosphotransferase (APT) family kinase protein
VLGVLYGTFIAKPREQVVQAARQLMRLKLIFLAYLRDLHQIDQAFTRRMLEDKPMPLEEVDRFRLMIEQAMAVGAQQLEQMEAGKAAATPAPKPGHASAAGKP